MHADSNSGSHNDPVQPARRPRAGAAARGRAGRPKTIRDEPAQVESRGEQQPQQHGQKQQRQPKQPPPASPVPEPEPPYQYKALTARRVAANRGNAARSTGPRTARGKARSARNATKHGAWSRTAVLPA